MAKLRWADSRCDVAQYESSCASAEFAARSGFADPCRGGWRQSCVQRDTASNDRADDGKRPCRADADGHVRAILMAPTLVQEVESSFTGTVVTVTTPAFSAVTDNLLMAVALNQDDAALSISNSGTALTWTVVQDYAPTTFIRAKIWANTLPNDITSMTVSSAASSSLKHGVDVTTWDNQSGVGNSNHGTTSGAPSLVLTTSGDNSAIIVAVGDSNGVDGASRVWRSVNGAPATELLYMLDGFVTTFYIGYYADAGPAGAKTVGLSAPGGQAATIVAAELFDYVAPPPPEQTDIIRNIAAR